MPQQEEIVYVGKPGDGPGYLAPSTASTGELVVCSSSSSLTTIAKNLVGLPPLYTGKMEEQPNNASIDGNFEEKRKAMDRLRKVSAHNSLLPLLCSCVIMYVYVQMFTSVNKLIIYPITMATVG